MYKNIQGSATIRTEGAGRGVVDLSEYTNTPGLLSIKSDLRTNTGYTVGISLLSVSDSVLGTSFADALDGLAFANQPANDAVEVVSDTVGDTRTVTIYGTTNGLAQVFKRTVVLNGTTPVASAKGDWGIILGVEVDEAHATAVITVREASTDQAITTIAATTTSTGVTDVDSQSCYGLPVAAWGDGATTKVVGVVGVDELGNVAYDTITLAGTTAVYGRCGLRSITKLLYGDVESSVSVVFGVGSITPSSAQWTLGNANTASVGSDGVCLSLSKRYLHWCVANGATVTVGGVADWIKLLIAG